MRKLTVSEVHGESVQALGLDRMRANLASVEAIAASFRRAAGFLCPCSPGTLTRAVTESLKELVREEDCQDVAETLEALVAYGDLVELKDAGRQTTGHDVLLYAAPPAFVYRQSGTVLLIGIVPDRMSPLPAELVQRIQYVNHVRRLVPQAGEELRSELLQCGLIAIPFDRWTKVPSRDPAEEHLRRLDRFLAEAPQCGDIPNLLVLDPELSVNYYRGRWRDSRSLSGRFVARRPQVYGADLWCYVEIESGHPRRLLDLPLASGVLRGCDEAWHLQAAIDAVRKHPQCFRLRPGREAGTTLMEFFSPVPRWARRRWDSFGEATKGEGTLFSYRFREEECAEEVEFARECLWMREMTSSAHR